MNRSLLIAGREFGERLRSRTFLISNASIMGIILLSVLLPLLFGHGGPTDLGYTGSAAPVAELAVVQQDNFEVELELTSVPDRAVAEDALASGDLDAVLLDPAVVLVDGNLDPRLEALLASASSAIAIDTTLTAAGLTPEERVALLTIEPLTIEQATGATPPIDLTAPEVVPVFGAVFLLYGLLAVYGQWVAQGIVEEKQSRVVEVLLGSVRPTELLAGKILGLGALGLAQVLLLGGVGAIGLLVTGAIDVPGAAWGALALVVPWYVLGFLVYAALFAMAGSVVARVEDMQSAVMPVIVVLVLALFAAQFALSDPGGLVARGAGVFPLTAPIVQPVLFATGQVAWLEVVLALVLAVGTIAALIPVTARIYRGGVLRTRGRLSYREAWRSTGRGRRDPAAPSISR